MLASSAMAINARYKMYLKSPQWKQKREQVFAHYGKRCYACKTYRGPIQVHHLSYAHFGNERIDELRPLCIKCHREVTALHWKMGKRKFSGFQVFATFMKTKRP